MSLSTYSISMPAVRPLDEATLAHVAETVGGHCPAVCFRLGLHLGLSPAQVDSILQVSHVSSLLYYYRG